VLALTQNIFERLARSGRTVSGLWAIGACIAVTIVLTALLVSQGEL